MKVMGKHEVEVVTDILCDVCDESTSGNGKHPPEHGTLQANWGYDSRHDGEAYEVHLCEQCFFEALANLQGQRRTNIIFSENGYEPNPEFGLVKRS
jgi:hypothetical protein